MKPKILVLGGSGFVGKEVVRALCAGGHAVRATYSVSAPDRPVEFADVDWIAVDLENSESIKAALEGCVAVIHAAGYEPKQSVTVAEARRGGVGELRRVFDECLAQGVLRIVYVSSVSTMNHGELERVYDETDFYTPGQFSEAYFETKYSMEAELYRYFDKGLEIVVALPSLILGPGCINSPTRLILKKELQFSSRALDTDDDAENQRVNVVDVRDVASALVAAMERGRAGRRYVLGGINTDLHRVRELFHDALIEKNSTLEEFFSERASAHFVADLVDKVRSSRAKPIAEKLATYIPEQITESFGNIVGLGEDLQADKPRWYGVHVNSQRARGELGHRPRLLAQTISSSISSLIGD